MMRGDSTILVVDDDPAILMGLTLKIKRHGYQVISAKDGNEGLKMVKKHMPDLVLSDVMMPYPDGFEMRKLLNEDERYRSIPFIFLTARTEVQDRLKGFREGADDYIAKPFDADELLARIDAVFQRIEAERTRVEGEMKAQAQQDMDKLKHEILQNFHHELNTPLTNILLPLEIAVGNKYSSPEELSRFLQMALSNANRLESLIADLVLLSHIDSGNLNGIRQPVDLNSQLLAPIRKRLARYRSKELEFVQDIPLEGEIQAPRHEFVSSVLHLVDNACKFSPDNGKVNLEIRQVPEGLLVSVQDEGPGIPPELREKVFERFYQISSGDTRKYEGLGVGLTIARAVFENLSGSVRIVDSTQGCRVEALLPA
jgi:two-component system, sensor histidine kinase and response regulator